MKILESHQQFEKKHIIKLDEKSSLNQKVISLKQGSVLHAKNYLAFNVFLVSGQAEISCRGYADKAIIGKSNIREKIGLFNIYNHAQTARCISDCRFLVVGKITNAVEENVANNKNTTMNMLDDIKSLIIDKKIEQELLEKKCHRMKNSNKKLLMLLKARKLELNNSNSIKKEENFKEASVKENNEKFLSVIEEDKNSSLEPVDHMLDRNVHSFFKGMIQFIQSNMLHVALLSKMFKSTTDKNNFSCKKNYNVIGHDWLRMNEAYPMKSGMYYISDGKEVAVSYFNQAKRVFHLTSELDIRYWSTKIVTLPQ